MKISTMHPRVVVGSEQYNFILSPDNPNEYFGEVPDDVGEILLKIARKPHEFKRIVDDAPSPEPSVYATEDKSSASNGADGGEGAPKRANKKK